MKVSSVLVVWFILLEMSLLPPSAQGAARSAKNSQTAASFPDSVDGLRDFLRAYIESIKDADFEKRARLDESLHLPEPQKWFSNTYDPRAGPRQANIYIGNFPEIYGSLDGCDLGPSMEIHIGRVDFPNENAAKLSTIPFLTSVIHPAPFYSVYLGY